MKLNNILLSLLVVSTVSFAEDAPVVSDDAVDAEQSQQPTEQQVVAPSPPPELNQKMFELGKQKLYPLSTTEMKELDKTTTEFNQLKDELKMGDAKPQVTSERLVEKPGAKIMPLYLHVGLDTIVTFLDSFGQPWPIDFAATSNKGAYKVTVVADHMLRIETKKPDVTADLTVLMIKGSLPFKFALNPSTGNVDTSKSYVIEGKSPTSKHKAPSSGGREPVPDADYDMNTFLDDVPPKDAVAINVNGPRDVEAWKYKNFLVVKTQKQLTQPMGIPTFGANDWKVYRVDNPMPVLVLLQDGEEHYAYLPEDEIADLGQKDKGEDNAQY